MSVVHCALLLLLLLLLVAWGSGVENALNRVVVNRFLFCFHNCPRVVFFLMYQQGGGAVGNAYRDGAGGALGSNPGSNIPIDRSRLYTPVINTAGQQAVYGSNGPSNGGYGNYPAPAVQSQNPQTSASGQNIHDSGGVDGNYGSARIQTARSRMLGGSAMSNIMSPQNGGAQNGSGSNARNRSNQPGPYQSADTFHAPPAGVSTGQRNGQHVSRPPSSVSTKSQYALELEQQMREKQLRDQKERELDRADGIVRPGGRRSRVVSQLRDTIQENRAANGAEPASNVNSSRQRMLGGNAMGGILGMYCEFTHQVTGIGPDVAFSVSRPRCLQVVPAHNQPKHSHRRAIEKIISLALKIGLRLPPHKHRRVMDSHKATVTVLTVRTL